MASAFGIRLSDTLEAAPSSTSRSNGATTLKQKQLDGAASSASFSLIQNADGPLTISQIRLKINGLMIDVLVEVGLVWNLETLPEL